MTRSRKLGARFAVTLRAAIATVAVALTFATAQAATVGLLTFEGPLQASVPPGGIGVLSYTLTPSTQTGTAAGRGAQPGTLQITKNADASSPKLLEAASMGQHISTMRLNVGGRTYTFEDVLIASYRSSSLANAKVPVETVTFSFAGLLDSLAPTTAGPPRVPQGAPALQPAAQPTPTRTP
jgi:hypothetical protein